ncbi:sulfhydryl oxidase 1 [Alligator mississippiensis]|uniref:sulfhydryl oxidase 1 n=1 Tax=Alligator mississippiensis TaxID=8496 RepID=UPI0028773AC0|nr:sulfhydryl oxidase 1 [Alligator mississippiensis]
MARVLLLALVLAVALPGARPQPEAGLYSAADPVVLLRAETLGRSVLNSSSAWAVEFYASWCGHCKRFAPTWLALAADILEWRPAVILGAVNCADEFNEKVCRDFRITGYPTLKFFEAFSRSPEDGKRISHVDSSLQALRQGIITHLEKYQDVYPPLEPGSTEEVHGFFQKNKVAYLSLIFEKNDSFVGREVTLDMQQYMNIAVRRVLSNEEELVKEYNVTTFPSAYLLVSNGSFSRISVQEEARSSYTSFLRGLSGINDKTLILKAQNVTTPPPSRVPDAEHPTETTHWNYADSSKLYMADLESALHHSLRVETAKFSILEGEQLEALKRYVAVLTKYFPGRPFVKNFLHSLDNWLEEVKEPNISHRALEKALKNKKDPPNPAVLTNSVTWVGCQGSEPRYRGYSCSIWTLFHLLTVQASLYSARNAGPLEVLGAMRGYVRYFFGCETCSEHFEQMAAESMDQVKSLDEAILWLWSRHNRVNARLAGDLTEDPKFPKMQWPPPDMCPSCHKEINGQHAWDEAAVLHFLKGHYSPVNIYFAYTKPEKFLLARDSRDAEETTGVKGKGNGIAGMEDKGRREEEEGGEQRRTEQVDPVVGRKMVAQKWQALKAAALAAKKKQHLSKRDTTPLLMTDDNSRRAVDYAAAQEHLRRRGLKSKEIIGVLEEEGDDGVRKSRWFHVLGLGYSHLDISLYFLSSMCLLGMYTFYIRLGSSKGRPRFPMA